jgi:hypothetical protein
MTVCCSLAVRAVNHAPEARTWKVARRRVASNTGRPAPCPGPRGLIPAVWRGVSVARGFSLGRAGSSTPINARSPRHHPKLRIEEADVPGRRLVDDAMDLGDRNLGLSHLGHVEALGHSNLAHGRHQP